MWTLIYNGTEKVWDDDEGKGWGISQGRLTRRSFETDEMTFVADGQPIDSAPLFTYQSPIIVMRDRIQAANGSFSGGTQYFVGIVTSQRRIGKPSSESVLYTISGPWWYLKQDSYMQLLNTISLTPIPHVVLNMGTTNTNYGENISITAQVLAILNNALMDFGDIFTVDTVDLNAFELVFPPLDEKRDLTYAEALKAEFKWAPRTVAWFDYTQSPPVLHINQNISLNTTTLNVTDGVTIVSEDIVPRYDLQVSQVWFYYEETNEVNDVSQLAIVQDIYPSVNTDPVGIMRATVNLQGLKGTDEVAILTTQDIVLNALTNAEAGNNSWWLDKHPELNDYTNIVIHNVVISPSGVQQTTFQQYEIVDGCFHKWMYINNNPSQPAGIQQDATVTALVDYTDQFGQICVDHKLTVKVKTTNLQSGTYTRLKITQIPEPLPIGLAQVFYNVLSVLPWEGEVVVEGGGGSDGSDVTTQQFLGCNLNLTGGLADWSTMLATVNEVQEDIDTGQVAVKFGPNKWLSPEQIVDLLRVFQTRVYTFWSNTATWGLVNQTDVAMPDNTVKENSSTGQQGYQKRITQYTDKSNNQTTLTEDALNGIISAGTNNPSNGSFSLSLQDIVSNQAQNPLH